MTMHHAPHPDDERLAAYAGGDADAVADRALTEHLIACERCRPIADELTLLRGALAALPDLAPSRPLRLIPPVLAPAAGANGLREWIRRLTAPAMAAGAGLVLIGAVGASGVVNQLGGRVTSNAPYEQAAASDSAQVPGAAAGSSTADRSRTPMPGDTLGGVSSGQSSEPRSLASGLTATPAPVTTGSDGEFMPFGGSSGRSQPWLTLVIAGVAVFGISAVLRYSLSPRAG